MAWDDTKADGSEVTGSEWNSHVSHQKGHASEHESGGNQEITHNNLSINSDDHHSKYTDSEAVTAVESAGTVNADISGDADSVDGYDLYVQDSAPSTSDPYIRFEPQ